MSNVDQLDLVKKAAYSADPWVDSNQYFVHAEKYGPWLWKNMIFPFIKECDFSHTLDLAAGHGRNSVFLAQIAPHLTITDFHATNVEKCRTRFAENENIDYFVCNGFDLSPLNDDSLSLIYCFDSMVHFEADVVRSYLHDSARVLKNGGCGFFHHSNYTGGTDWRVNPSSRNFMSKDIFADYATSAGLHVIKQKTINWGDHVDLDCFSLVKKL